MSESKSTNQKGFTILELMIATMVFGVMLVLLSTVVVSVTRLFYKGVATARTQQAARTVSEEIGRTIQFAPSGSLTVAPPQPVPPPPPAPAPNPALAPTQPGRICIDRRGFYYILGIQLSELAGPNRATRTTILQTGCDDTMDIAAFNASTESELLGKDMRLSKLEVVPLPNNGYRITAKVSYGDDDLLNDPTGPDAQCKSGSGSQFCAVSEITITVFKRF